MRSRGGLLFAVLLVVISLAGARTVAGWVLDYQWWKELGQVSTWISMMLYSVGPGLACWLLAFVVLWITHARGMKAGGTRLGAHTIYARLATLAIAVVAAIYAAQAVDSWEVVRYFGGMALGADGGWRDPVYGQPLAFYFFELPFYRTLLTVVMSLSLIAAVVHLVTSRGWYAFLNMGQQANSVVLNIGNDEIAAAFQSKFFRTLISIFLAGLAVWFYLRRYEWLLADHGFMVGVDWTAETVRLPLLWMSVIACVLAAGFIWMGRLRFALAMVVVPMLGAIVPQLVTSLYVKPNEIAIQKPYIQRHIQATRLAYGLTEHIKEKDFPARREARVNVDKNKALLDNVRLWDWQAFKDTVSQIQPLRPYVYSDADVDRYTIGGQLRQVLIAPRELDLNQLGDARNRWANPNTVYTHGYGLVLGEANRIDSNGLPILFIRNAPPEILTPSLKLTRPELYYGEQVHEPVFVRTNQPEFNYPSGSNNVHTTYEGTGGFPISSAPMRLAASLVYGDWNILLTSQLTSGSRMMIHRSITERLHTLAGFITWDADPYLVIAADGTLHWFVDGYVTSNVHPYSRSSYLAEAGGINYIRNSVKATVDAYNGSVKLYVFDEADPLIRAYQKLFPALLTPMSEMPADLRAHARYPEAMFRVQAEMYRTFHMLDAESFYNKADLWDLAGWVQDQSKPPQPIPPAYVVATLPGEANPEFVLSIPFTPHSKDNLIGLMMARCDGAKLGETNVLLLSKSETIYGPMQVEARINQDQTISKDLTLWNQQGSQVLHGQMLVLPVDDTFMYVHPIYIQAREARMPQLKKVVVAVGSSLIYTDTWEQAMAQLAALSPGAAASASSAAPPPPVLLPAGAAPGGRAQGLVQQKADPVVDAIRDHLQRYRSLAAQGKWGEAGKELEAIEGLVRK